MRKTCYLTLSMILLHAAQLHAGFVLDDFDDPAETISPEMENVPVVTDSVGVLNATRTIEIAGGGVDPVARFDTNVSSPSILSAQLSELTRTDSLTPLLAFQFNYEFTPADVSEGGRNDAILIDFLSTAGNATPSSFRLIVFDDKNIRESFLAEIVDLPIRSDPFTAAIPFSSFTIRGGAPGLPDFTTVRRMDFDFFFLGLSETAQWSAKVDKIRFGRIPEPSTLAISLGILLTIFLSGRRRLFLLKGGLRVAYIGGIEIEDGVCTTDRVGKGVFRTWR